MILTAAMSFFCTSLLMDRVDSGRQETCSGGEYNDAMVTVDMRENFNHCAE